MTAIDAKAFGAGAPSRAAQMWDQTHWSHMEAEVKRLQVRIAKSTGEGRWGKVKALQRLLTRSHSGKMLAVKRVTENRGKRTPGGGRKDMIIPDGEVERNVVASTSRLSCDAVAACRLPRPSARPCCPAGQHVPRLGLLLPFLAPIRTSPHAPAASLCPSRPARWRPQAD